MQRAVRSLDFNDTRRSTPDGRDGTSGRAAKLPTICWSSRSDDAQRGCDQTLEATPLAGRSVRQTTDMTIADSSRELLAWICELEDRDPARLADVPILTNHACQRGLISPPQAQEVAGRIVDLVDRGLLAATDPLASLDQPTAPWARATMMSGLRATALGRDWVANGDVRYQRPAPDEATSSRRPLRAEPSASRPPKEVFISHAHHDKDVVRPLAAALVDLGWSVWLDELELAVGDSLSGRLETALAESRFGVVVLSPAFFAKQWPLRELAALTAREVVGGAKVVLPVWHDVDERYLMRHAPTLADRIGARTSDGIEHVAHKLAAALKATVTNSANARSATIVQSVLPESPATAARAQQLYVDGRYAEALPLWERILAERRETLGPDHLMTLSATHSTIYVLVRLDRLAEALALCNVLVEARLRLLGPDHESTRDAVAWLDHVRTRLHSRSQ